MTTNQFKHYLISRIFQHNDFGSTEELIDAINAANSLPNFAEAKRAMNQVATKAPLRNDSLGKYLNFYEVPKFIDEEIRAFNACVFNNPKIVGED